MTASSRGAGVFLARLGSNAAATSTLFHVEGLWPCRAAAAGRCYSDLPPDIPATTPAVTPAVIPSATPTPSVAVAATTEAKPSSRSPADADYTLEAGVMLSRPPLLTRESTPFEQAFFMYQRRLDVRTTLSFVQDFYYKRRTPARMNWDAHLRRRDRYLSRDVGRYRGRGPDQWNDELRAGTAVGDPARLRSNLVYDAVPIFNDDAELILRVERAAPIIPQSRETDADIAHTLTSLHRKLDRTLFLVVQDQAGRWRLPSAIIKPSENLHSSVQQLMDQAAGVNMHTWIVGKVPVAHSVTNPTYTADGTCASPGSKIFFLKARIMAGQANLHENPFGFHQFRWLVSEELESLLAPTHFAAVRLAMPRR